MDQQTAKRWWILGGLLAVTLLLVWRSSTQNAAMPTVHSVQRPHHVQAGNGTVETSGTEVPLILAARRPPADDITDLFAPRIVKKAPPPVVRAPVVIPQAPPLPFTFVGRMVENGRVKVFLNEGETLHTVGEGDLIGRNYKVLGLTGERIELLYLPLNIKQSIALAARPE